MPTDAEKREHKRAPFTAEAALEFASGKYQARISDISLSGCYVDSIVTIFEGDAISLTITSESHGSARFTGEVTYVLPGFGFGIRFTDLDEEKTDLLRQIID